MNTQVYDRLPQTLRSPMTRQDYIRQQILLVELARQEETSDD
jgi:hypothetical protein